MERKTNGQHVNIAKPVGTVIFQILRKFKNECLPFSAKFRVSRKQNKVLPVLLFPLKSKIKEEKWARCMTGDSGQRSDKQNAILRRSNSAGLWGSEPEKPRFRKKGLVNKTGEIQFFLGIRTYFTVSYFTQICSWVMGQPNKNEVGKQPSKYQLNIASSPHRQLTYHIGSIDVSSFKI